MSQRSARIAAAIATADVSEPPRPSVVTRPVSLCMPWKPVTTATSLRSRKRLISSAPLMSSMRAAACAFEVRIGSCQPCQERALTPMPSSTSASSPAVTCSPDATTASYSRASCSGAASRHQSTSRLVVPAMAETTTATSWPASTSRLTWRATLRIRSMSASDVPPNFMTRRDMWRGVPGKRRVLHSGEGRVRQPGRSYPLPLWERVAPKARGEGFASREDTPSPGSQLRCSPPSPTGGEGGTEHGALRRLADLRQMLRDQPQVLDELPVFPRLGRLVRQAQQEGRMHRDETLDAVAQRHQLSARARDRLVAAGQRPRRGRAERHRDLRLEKTQLVLQPPVTGFDLVGVRLLVNAPLAARLEFEVLHGIRDVDAGAVDAGLGERAVEHLPGRSDERLAGQILLVARLLADEHDPRVRRPLAEHGLGRVLVERAALAMLGRLAGRGETAEVGVRFVSPGRGREQVRPGLAFSRHRAPSGYGYVLLMFSLGGGVKPALERKSQQREAFRMDYRNLGASGLKVSPLCLGTMMFGGPTDEATATRIVAKAKEQGVNFIDSADGYAGGKSEEITGRAIGNQRHD